MEIFGRIKVYLTKRSVQGFLAVIVAVILTNVFVGDSGTSDDATIQQKPVVTLTSSAVFGGGQSISLIGNVRAFTEAAVTSESAGRVTSVNVTLGQTIAAGTVLATLESASERAAMLQAEGAYDAAVAAAAQSGVGVDEASNSLRQAQDNAVSAFKSAYNTTNGVIVGSIDTFFSNPNGFIPGLKITGQGYTSQLNSERVAYQTLLPEWQGKVNSISDSSDLVIELEYAKSNVERTINILDMFLIIFSKHGGSNAYSDEELVGLTNTFTGLRSSLIAVQSSLDNAISGLSSAADGVRRAELAAAGGVTSAADAQVKQALGVLRAAQANYNKTILRAPVSGTVNSLSVRTGDFINSFTEVAVVANNNALEVIAYMSDAERDILNVGDEVSISDAYPGFVTHISPAVNSLTKKIEVRIATEGQGIANGDTVRITKEVAVNTSTSSAVQVPLTAIKFERENGSVFGVEDGKLVSKPVTIGKIFGSSVEITAGLSVNDEFVLDARGLIEGEEVEIIK